MEPEYLSPCTQERAFCPWSEPEQSSASGPIFLKIHFNIILPSAPSSKWSLFFRFPYQTHGLCFPFRNLSRFYDEAFLASRRYPKLDVHPLSAVRHCLFSVFEASFHVCRPSSPSKIWWRTKLCWQGPKCSTNLRFVRNWKLYYCICKSCTKLVAFIPHHHTVPCSFRIFLNSPLHILRALPHHLLLWTFHIKKKL